METDLPRSKTSGFFNLSSALFAFCLWGGWAYYVNYRDGSGMGLTSGLTQGIASFTITIIMVYAVTWLYQRMPTSPMRFVAPAFITVCVTGSCLYSLHSLVDTPSIIYTIAPALSVAFVFCVFTCVKLNTLPKPSISTKET